MKVAKEELENKTKRIDELTKKLHLEKGALSQRFPIKEDIIELNVGGTFFTTYKSTLTQYEGTLLEAMFSGRHPLAKDSSGRFFLDRSPEMFRYILELLRNHLSFSSKDSYQQMLWEKELEFFGLEDIIDDHPFGENSKIIALLTGAEKTLLQGWLAEGKTLNLIYQGTRDGFQGHTFHSKCDFKGPTLCIILSSGFIFGGYNDVDWNSAGSWSNSAKTWIFSLKNPHNFPSKLNCQNPPYAMLNSPNNGPTFGNNDLQISQNCSVNPSTSQIGHSYTPPNMYNGQTFLTGQRNFLVSEIEVFQVI